jgi:hypothetical protein
LTQDLIKRHQLNGLDILIAAGQRDDGSAFVTASLLNAGDNVAEFQLVFEMKSYPAAARFVEKADITTFERAAEKLAAERDAIHLLDACLTRAMSHPKKANVRKV